ncbi:hypothetical protein D3C72_2113010 [compost metagenome]
MHDHVLKQITRLLDQFRIEPDMRAHVIATAPFGLHPLQEISLHLYPDPSFPLIYKIGNHLVQQGSQPRLIHGFAAACVGSWAHIERDAPVVHFHNRRRIALNHFK